MMYLEECGRRTYCPEICLGGLTKTRKTSNQDHRHPSRHSSRHLPNISQKRYRLSQISGWGTLNCLSKVITLAKSLSFFFALCGLDRWAVPIQN
jgi:hypothetical protein